MHNVLYILYKYIYIYMCVCVYVMKKLLAHNSNSETHINTKVLT